MKEIFIKFLQSNMFDSFTTYLGGIIFAFIIGKAMPQFKFQIKRAEKKYRDLMPDWLEPIFDKWFKKAQQQLIEELLKHSKGLESETPTEIQKVLKEIVDNATATRENNLKENFQNLVLDKVQEVVPKISEKLLDMAQDEIVNKVAFDVPVDSPQYKLMQGVTENSQTIEAIKGIKELPKDKNWIAQVYAELSKEDGKELEGKIGGSLTGRI